MALNEGTVAQESVYSLTEVAYHFQVTTDLLHSWTQRFAQVLSPVAQSEPPKFSNTDVAALSMVQRLLSQGLPDDQVNAHLIPRRLVQEEPSALALAHEQNRQLAEVKAGGSASAGGSAGHHRQQPAECAQQPVDVARDGRRRCPRQFYAQGRKPQTARANARVGAGAGRIPTS